ncbi:MAG: SUF system NifU family Fe-S cluster assembly protein [Spongiibacteraceae bacterium]|jgi:nitrogen fixation NifU-like protein|nr:SUF system NifU family Fe-S cluster assembly protein [Spongiibacteraceae bacterium]
MNPELRALYQEMILDHGRRPRHFGVPEHYTHKMEAFNPLCGDRLTLYATLEDGNVKAVQFEGQGCAISMASASMMCEEVEGKACADARTLYEHFQQLVTGQRGAEDIGRLEILAGVRHFPSRVKCATLAWHSLDHMLRGDSTPVSTE